jgi:hypothetical protein
VKRLRWSAVLLGLVLATTWASAAQATGTTTTTMVEQTTTTTAPQDTTTTTEPGGGLKPCSASEGLASHSAISVDKASAHPSASASFTVKEGCQVAVFLFAGKGNGDENTELFDFAPEGDPVAGPGDHTLTVDLPDCSEFIVDFVAFPPETAESGAAVLSRARTDAARVMAEGDQPPDDSLLDEVIDETTNCPTQTTNGEVAAPTTTTEGAGALPFTGTNAMPMLLTGLVLVAGGAAAVLGSRLRGRATK